MTKIAKLLSNKTIKSNEIKNLDSEFNERIKTCMYFNIDNGIFIDNRMVNFSIIFIDDKWINFNKISIEKQLVNFNSISRYRYIGSAKINTRHEAIEECLYLDLCTIYNIFSDFLHISVSIHVFRHIVFHTNDFSNNILRFAFSAFVINLLHFDRCSLVGDNLC